MVRKYYSIEIGRLNSGKCKVMGETSFGIWDRLVLLNSQHVDNITSVALPSPSYLGPCGAVRLVCKLSARIAICWPDDILREEAVRAHELPEMLKMRISLSFKEINEV